MSCERRFTFHELQYNEYWSLPFRRSHLNEKGNMAKIKPRIKSSSNRVSLNWAQLNALITGVSAIDLGSLAIRTRGDAVRFANEYGFDLDNPIERERIVRVHKEAIQFIKSYFLSKEQHHLISHEVVEPENILDLLVFSSNYLNKSNLKQKWACAVLKVMHGICYIEHDFKLKYFDVIRQKIFRSLDKLVVSEGPNHFLVDKHQRIPLFFYEKKRNKDRNSILLKLLQKPSYMAADIYDHLGIRLIFETKTECLFALTLLRKSHLISVANIKPFRSRNNLIDIKSCKKVFNRFRPLLARAQVYPQSVFKRMDQEINAAFRNTARAGNPHSSEEYQAIQITARKMVSVPNPAYRRIQELMAFTQQHVELPRSFTEQAEIDKEYAFFFDYEIQLMDRESYLKAMHGPASHDAYKKRQREAARKRVLGPELIQCVESTPLEAKIGRVVGV